MAEEPIASGFCTTWIDGVKTIEPWVFFDDGTSMSRLEWEQGKPKPEFGKMRRDLVNER